MEPRRAGGSRQGTGTRVLTVLALPIMVLLVTLPVACGLSPSTGPAGTGGVTGEPGAGAASGPSATARPAPGHELYGYLPYWEMDGTIAAHLATTPLTTLALFSVTDTVAGGLDTGQVGYRRITGEPGTQIIAEAHARGVRVEVVFTSFGADRNGAFLADRGRQDAAIAGLVALVAERRLDGISVDVEGLDPASVPAFAGFVGRLREAVAAADPSDRITVATAANVLGAAMAVAALAAGADRAFLMGYDYRTAGSSPGATSPLDRRDGERDLGWSIDLYAAAGVPPERLLLGLPLYGMTWPVAGPVVGAPETGRGEAWIPRRHLDLLTDPAIVPIRDEQEMVEVYLFGSDGSIGAPSAGTPTVGAPTAGTSPVGAPPAQRDRTWTAVYVDSPATLAPKLGLANRYGFAGAGLWAIGYERGLPAFTDLMGRFVAGEPMP